MSTYSLKPFICYLPFPCLHSCIFTLLTPSLVRALRWPRFIFSPHCSINVTVGMTEERRLMTGMHTVADIQCNVCECVLGWKYVRDGIHSLRSRVTHVRAELLCLCFPALAGAILESLRFAKPCSCTHFYARLRALRADRYTQWRSFKNTKRTCF